MSTQTQEAEFNPTADWPDSCFAYVPKGGNPSDRKLPYRWPDGRVDLAHVRNALARLDQTDGISSEEKAKIRSMLQNILDRENPNYKPSNEEKLMESTREITKLQGRIVELTESMNEYNKSLNAKQTELIEAKGSVRRLEEEKASLTRRVQELQDALAKQKKDSEESHAKVLEKIAADSRQVLEEQKTHHEQEVTLWKTKHKEASDRLESLKKENEEKFTALNERVSKSEKEATEAIHMLEKKVDERDAKIINLQSTVFEQQLALNEQGKRVEKANIDKLEATKDNAIISEKMATLQTELTEAAKRNSELSKKLAEAGKEAQTLHEQLDTLYQDRRKMGVLTKQLAKVLKSEGKIILDEEGKEINPDEIT